MKFSVVAGTLAIISASVFGASVAGMSDGFCVSPGTLVAVPGGWKAVEELKVGETLREGIVEGILKTTGKGSKCVDISGVIMSSSHVVFENGWKLAKNHSSAKAVLESPDFLYCLNTSTRNWIVQTSNSELLLRDWEELPEGYDDFWENMICIMLNGKSLKPPIFSKGGRGTIPLDTMVLEKDKGAISIYEVCIGDHIKDSSNTYTEVLGKYEDVECDVESLWYWNEKLDVWAHPIKNSSVHKHGYHLITSSSTFFIYMIDGKIYSIRDFTEVGTDRIHETYHLTLSLLATSAVKYQS